MKCYLATLPKNDRSSNTNPQTWANSTFCHGGVYWIQLCDVFYVQKAGC